MSEVEKVKEALQIFADALDAAMTQLRGNLGVAIQKPVRTTRPCSSFLPNTLADASVRKVGSCGSLRMVARSAGKNEGNSYDP